QLLWALARRGHDLFERGVRRRPAALAGRRATREIRAHRRRARAAGRRQRAGDRLRLGRLRRTRGAAWPVGDRPHAVDRATRVGAHAHRARRPRRTRALRTARLPRRGRPLRRHRVDRAVRGGRRALLAFVLRVPAALPEARRPRGRPDDHHRRVAVRSLPPRHGLHPAVRVPGRNAAERVALRAAGRRGRAAHRRPLRVRSRLRAHAPALAGALRAGAARRARARFRPGLRTHLGVLPGLLRGRVRARQHRRRAVHARASMRRTSVPTRLAAARNLGTSLAVSLVVGIVAAIPALAEPAAPAPVRAVLDSATLAGEGALRWLGLRIYDARLWVGQRGIDPGRLDATPFALELRYARALSGAAIAERSAA